MSGIKPGPAISKIRALNLCIITWHILSIFFSIFGQIVLHANDMNNFNTHFHPKLASKHPLLWIDYRGWRESIAVGYLPFP